MNENTRIAELKAEIKEIEKQDRKELNPIERLSKLIAKKNELLEQMKKFEPVDFQESYINYCSRKGLLEQIDTILLEIHDDSNINWSKKQYLYGLLAQKSKIPKKELLEKVGELKSRDMPDPLPISDLLKKEIKDVEYYIRNLIPRDALVLFGGKPAAFKSMYILTLALACLSGKKHLDTFGVDKKAKILYYDLENGEKTLYHRIKYLAKGLGLSDSKVLNNFHVLFSFDRNNLEREITIASGYDIIILDSYRRFLKGTENESDVTDKFFNDYLQKIRKNGKTIIIIHHFKKANLDEVSDENIMDLFRGSSDIPAQFDVMYGLNKSQERVNTENSATEFDVHICKVKNRLGLPIKDFNFTVSKLDDIKQTDMSFLGFGKKQKPKDSLKNFLLTLLNNKTMSRSDLFIEIKKQFDYSESSMSKYLKIFVRENFLIQPVYGQYSLGQEYNGHAKPEVKKEGTQKKLK